MYVANEYVVASVIEFLGESVSVTVLSPVLNLRAALFGMKQATLILPATSVISSSRVIARFVSIVVASSFRCVCTLSVFVTYGVDALAIKLQYSLISIPSKKTYILVFGLNISPCNSILRERMNGTNEISTTRSPRFSSCSRKFMVVLIPSLDSAVVVDVVVTLPLTGLQLFDPVSAFLAARLAARVAALPLSLLPIRIDSF